MSIKTQIKKLEQYEVSHRSAFARVSALLLAAVTIFSMTELAHDGDKLRVRARVDSFAQTNFVARPVDPAEKNETVRMPIKFDDGLRAPATTGV